MDSVNCLSIAQSRLIRESFAELLRDPVRAGRIFHQRLIRLDPSLRLVIPPESDEPGRRLMGLLSLLVGGMDGSGPIAPDIAAFDGEWFTRSAKAGTFETIGTALLDMLAMTLGDGFTPEVAEAWAELYGITACLLEDTVS